jgi:D-glycero-beta-D-manno-heptose-7-phosphate kinase
MDKKNVHDLFNKFQSLNIMVIGDVMLDSYLWGKVERISPEAPVPVVSCHKKENRLGGAANVALNLKSLGAKAIMASAIGDDSIGDIILKLMKKDRLPDKLIIKDKTRKTTSKTRVISGSQQLIRIDEEICDYLDKDVEKEITERIANCLENDNIHAIIFQDYDKGVITPALIRNIVRQAQKLHIPTLVDPKKRNFGSYEGVNLFKPNFKEFAEGLKAELDAKDVRMLMPVSKKFLEKTSNHLLLLTLSDKGVFIADNKKYSHIPAHIRDIADVSGAGDTVISVAALCLAAGCNPSEIAAFANLAGGLVCEKVGVVPIEKQSFMDECFSLTIPEW